MDFIPACCPIRRSLEERTWFLTNLHAELTNRLMQLIERSHETYVAMLDRCESTALDITESRVTLKAHRKDHRC